MFAPLPPDGKGQTHRLLGGHRKPIQPAVGQLGHFRRLFCPGERLLLFSNYLYIQEEFEQLAEQVNSQYRRELKNTTKAKLSPPDRVLAGEEKLLELCRPGSAVFLSQSEFILPFPARGHKAPASLNPA